MRSESESDSLIAFPRSCIKLLRRSSTFCPFHWALPADSLLTVMQLQGHRFPMTSIRRINVPLIVQAPGCREQVRRSFDRMKSCPKASGEAGRQVRQTRSSGRGKAVHSLWHEILGFIFLAVCGDCASGKWSATRATLGPGQTRAHRPSYRGHGRIRRFVLSESPAHFPLLNS